MTGRREKEAIRFLYDTGILQGFFGRIAKWWLNREAKKKNEKEEKLKPYIFVPEHPIIKDVDKFAKYRIPKNFRFHPSKAPFVNYADKQAVIEAPIKLYLNLGWSGIGVDIQDGVPIRKVDYQVDYTERLMSIVWSTQANFYMIWKDSGVPGAFDWRAFKNTHITEAWPQAMLNAKDFEFNGVVIRTGTVDGVAKIISRSAVYSKGEVK